MWLDKAPTQLMFKLDRLGRSLRHLVELAGNLPEQDVGLES